MAAEKVACGQTGRLAGLSETKPRPQKWLGLLVLEASGYHNFDSRAEIAGFPRLKRDHPDGASSPPGI
jgi:hypothetical protein